MKTQNNYSMIKKYFFIAVAIFFLIFTEGAFGGRWWSIVPMNLSPLTVPSTSRVELTYTVTDLIGQGPPAGLHDIDPSYTVSKFLSTSLIKIYGN
ncbi:MAG TPA: hypothetical protein VJK30_04330 [Coxiellaceae bacterium]|nr:MAG: hypothetical protein A3E81_07655 [Gammaproteobacteria bacterium RIFCSPHIGHO2_12_FULL_36_30]HLB56537.1 hypothetical protein [Coxiellaceae bacterium]